MASAVRKRVRNVSHTMLPAVFTLGYKAYAVPEVCDVCLGLQALRFPLISTLCKKTHQLAWRACIGLGLTVFSGLCCVLRGFPVFMGWHGIARLQRCC